MDRIFCMRMFVRVVELESFTRASQELDVARSRATEAVADLEKQLGVRLLHRTTRRVTVTPDGRNYYERCVRILGDIAEAEDSLTSSRARPRGKLRVSAPYSFIRSRFFEELPRFLEAYPDLELDVVIGDRALNLVEEGIDCAVRGAAIADDSTLVARHIVNVRWLTCAAPAYLRKSGIPRRVEDLAGHNCIRFASPSTRRVSDWKFETDGVARAFTPHGNLTVNAFEAAASAALNGVGICQVPGPIAAGWVREKKLKAVLLEHAAPAPSVQVVYPSNRYLSAKVRAFADFVAEVFAKP